MEHKKLKFFSHISRLHNGFIFVPSFRGPPRGPGPRAPKLLKMALLELDNPVLASAFTISYLNLAWQYSTVV